MIGMWMMVSMKKNSKPHGFYKKAKRNFDKKKASMVLGDSGASKIYKFLVSHCETADVLYYKREVKYDYANRSVAIPFRHYGVNIYGRIILSDEIDSVVTYSKDGTWKEV